jgi:hypothetical protein
MATLETISDHIIDICENAVRSNSKECKLIIIESKDFFSFEVKDYGIGMNSEELNNALTPFYTTKKERKKKIGMGLPFLKFSCELTGGSFNIKTKPNNGTTVNATFVKTNIDCQPLGDLSNALYFVIYLDSKIDWYIKRTFLDDGYEIDTKQLKNSFENIYDTPKFMLQIKQNIYNLEKELKGGF